MTGRNRAPAWHSGENRGGVTPGIAREVRATAWFTLHSVFENGESLYIVLGVVFCYNTSRTIPPACSAACNMGASDIMDSAPFPHQQHSTNRGAVNSGWPMSILRARPFYVRGSRCSLRRVPVGLSRDLLVCRGTCKFVFGFCCVVKSLR